MTLQGELSRPLPDKQRRKHKPKRKRKAKRKERSLPPPLSLLLDDQILCFGEWCKLNRFSERQGRRILNGDKGKPPKGTPPPVVQLSEQRIGIRVGDNRRWQESRARGSR